MTFLIGFCLGGVVGCDSPRTNTNTLPPAIRLKYPRKISKSDGGNECQIKKK